MSVWCKLGSPFSPSFLVSNSSLDPLSNPANFKSGSMSGTSSVPIGPSAAQTVAPTPQNTPLTTAPLAAGLSRPTVPTIGEEKDEGDDNGSDANGPPQTPPEGGPLDKLGPAGQAAMLGMVQARLQGLMGRSSGYIESLPIGTKRKVEALKGVQVKWEELHLQFKMESIELEKKVILLLGLGLVSPRTLMEALLFCHISHLDRPFDFHVH